MPIYDTDQFVFASDNEDLNNLNVKSFGISKNLLFYKNKIKTNNYLKSINIPTPLVFPVSDVKNEQQYIVKPINGCGSSGVKVLFGNSIKELPNIDDFIIQEICSEPEYTLECFYYNNQIYSVTRERIASKSGVCVKTCISQNKKLENYAQLLMKHTQLPHIFNMQFMRNQSNEYVCTDLNLRAAGGMSLSYAAGWDEVSALANIMLNKDEQSIIQFVNKQIKRQYIVRFYSDTVTKIISQKIAFDFDGTIIDSRQRHQKVMAIILQKYGFNTDVSDLVDFKSDGKNNIDWLISKGIPFSQADHINKDWIQLIENEEFLKSDSLYEGVVNTLRTLSENNDLYLITARNNKEGAMSQIQKSGISKYFSDIIIVPSNKNSAELKSKELRRLEIDVFVGDTELDFQASTMADCHFYAVSQGFRSKEFLKRNMVKKIFDDISSIPF